MGANSKVRLSVLLRVQGLLLFIEGLFMVMHLFEKKKKEIVRKGFGFLF